MIEPHCSIPVSRVYHELVGYLGYGVVVVG